MSGSEDEREEGSSQGERSSVPAPVGLASQAMIANAPPPTFLNVPGQPQIPFETWIKMYDNFVTLSGLKSWGEEQQKAHFISCLGTEGQRVFFGLPRQDESLKSARRAVKLRFTAETCEETARYQFKRRKQLPGESIDDFVQELRSLVINCRYDRYGAQCEQDMIRDQIIEKCAGDAVRERLLSAANEKARQEDRLTLEATIVIVRAMETVRRDADLLAGRTGVEQVNKVGAPTKGRFGKGPMAGSKPADSGGTQSSCCFACGRVGHKASDDVCRAKGRKCHFCGVVGHFSKTKMCKGKSSSGNESRKHAHCRNVESSVATGKCVCTTRKHGECADLHVCNRTNVLNVDSLEVTGSAKVSACVTVVSNGVSKDLTMLVDTGSSVSIIPSQVYRSFFQTSELSGPPRKLTNYSGGEIPVLGCIDAEVTVADRTCTTQLYVVRNGTAVIGLDVIRGVKLNFSDILAVDSCSEVVSEPDVEVTDSARASDSVPTGVGKVKGYVHKVKLKADARPLIQKRRPLPLAVREKVRNELVRLETEDVIERIDSSEWVSPIVVVNKKTTDDIRLCIDLSKVNKNIVVDCYPIPMVEELLNSFSGASVFTSLDLKSAYNQIPLHPESRDLTAFVTEEGLFRYKRVPFGLASAPSFFQKFMSTVLKGLPGVQWYLDDIIVFGKDRSEHDLRLREVMQRLDEVGLRLNLSKCKVRKDSVEYLGHSVSGKGVAPLEEKVSALMEMKPTTVTELRTMLGMVQYYARFIPNLASLTQPLREIIKSHSAEVIVWTEVAHTALVEVKRALMDSPALSSFDGELPTIVTTDASGRGLGAVLSQVHADGAERVVAFASKSLSEAEAKYSTLELEALACVWAVERWHVYLWGRRFLLRTDHNPLTFIFDGQSKRVGHRVARWRSRLLVYNFEISHVKGEKNVVADAMSRLPESRNSAFEDEETEVVATIEAVDKSKFVAACREDNTLGELRRLIEADWKGTSTLDRFYFRLKNEFSLQGDVVLREGRIVVPESYQKVIVDLAHESHQGITKCKQWIRSLYWWKGMDKMVEVAVRQCAACNANDKSVVTRTAPMTPVKLPEKVWQKVGIDVVGPFEIASRDYRFAVTLVDYRSKWPEMVFMRSVRSCDIIPWLNGVFAREGFPEELVSDNGSQFVSNEFEQYLRERGIRHLRSSVYYPRANGEVERFNRTLKHTIQLAVEGKREWIVAVTEFLMAYRATPNCTTGVSPSALLHGRTMRTKLMLARDLQQESTVGVDERVDEFQLKSKAYADERRAATDMGIRPGDMVRVKQAAVKGHPSYGPPQRVSNMCAPHTAVLEGGSRVNQSRLTVVPPTQHPHQEVASSPTTAAESHRAQRVRRPPVYLNDYV